MKVDAPEYSRLSWRDPDGFVIKADGRILRAVALNKAEQTRELLRSPWMTRLIAEGSVPGTVELPNPPQAFESSNAWVWLEHEALKFPCYPHEMTALQLYDAGQLTINIALQAAEHGWMLKDASAWNVLYALGRPVFVDLLSFEKLQPSASWIAYGQFVRHFLLPLMLYQKLGVTPSEIFLTYRDGITPEHAYSLLHGLKLVSRAGMELVLLPKWLSRSGSRMIAGERTRKPRTFEASLGLSLLLRTLRRLRVTLERLRPDHSRYLSVWKGYEEDRLHYADSDLKAKTEFVRQHLGDCRSVLDLGCNAGEFSLLAAEQGKIVVAADADHPALSRLYARIRGRAAPITPFLLNIGRPTPAVGWQNKEVASFLDRSAGQFDCILLLGLIHHLLVSERATLQMLSDLLDRLDPTRVILEWVDPQDQKFQQLAGLNHALYSRLTTVQFEEQLAQKFCLVEKLPLPCATRVMYLWRRR